jgi:fructosamine-3-kinase
VDSSPSWLARLASIAGPIAGRPARLGGDAWAVVAGSRKYAVKLGAGALDEADGLGRLGRVRGAPPVPEVVLAEPGLLVTSWVEQGPATAGHYESLGRALGALHLAPFPHWGGGAAWIGACPVQSSPAPDAASFYGTRLRELSARCGLEAAVEGVVVRLGDLLPPGGPALVHGDLWWGNVLFGSDGRSWLIDPSVHGGHPEEDLAMLALFGQVPDRLFHAYVEVQPLCPGWEGRVALFQLLPLLVHSVLFGGGYRARADALARSYA